MQRGEDESANPAAVRDTILLAVTDQSRERFRELIGGGRGHGGGVSAGGIRTEAWWPQF